MFLVFSTAGFDHLSFIFVTQTVAGRRLNFQKYSEDLNLENLGCNISVSPPSSADGDNDPC